ncbi:hypothetical protein, partial [Burkholderia pseudomallei]|uniref:hypothetical protein n=1 Tax=Burkholderia pseudomallei TaxID=28450 RepID=UPI000F076278
MKVRSSIAIAAADHERTPRFILRRGEPLGTAERLAVTAARAAAAIPRYYLHAPIIGALASQARHDSRPQSLMIRG